MKGKNYVYVDEPFIDNRHANLTKNLKIQTKNRKVNYF